MLNEMTSPRPIRRYAGKHAKGEIVCGEALQWLSSLPDESVDLVFLDPPFNLGKEYCAGRDLDARDPQEYDRWLRDVLT